MLLLISLCQVRQTTSQTIGDPSAQAFFHQGPAARLRAADWKCGGDHALRRLGGRLLKKTDVWRADGVTIELAVYSGGHHSFYYQELQPATWRVE